tara:strand:+ start:56559 stop:56864 length:306 start_codon:yes stop_codon:yes gene_type:complete
MNNYKDFIIKTLIITFAVLIVIFFLLSPINKVLRVADSLLMKIDRLERKIGDQTLKGYITNKLYHESKSDGIDLKQRQKLINSVNIILKRDIKPIIDGIDY